LPDPTRPSLVPHPYTSQSPSHALQTFHQLGVPIDIRGVPTATLGTLSARPAPPPNNHDLVASARLAIGNEILQQAFALGMVPTNLGTQTAQALVDHLLPAVATTLAGRTRTRLSLFLRAAPAFVDPEAEGVDFRIRLPLLHHGELTGSNGTTTPVDVAIDLEIALMLQPSPTDKALEILVRPGNGDQTRLILDDAQPLHPTTPAER